MDLIEKKHVLEILVDMKHYIKELESKMDGISDTIDLVLNKLNVAQDARIVFIPTVLTPPATELDSGHIVKLRDIGEGK